MVMDRTSYGRISIPARRFQNTCVLYLYCLIYTSMQLLYVVKPLNVRQSRYTIRKSYSQRRISTGTSKYGSLDFGNDIVLRTESNEASKFLNRSFFPIYYNDVYEVTLPPNHRFPMEKYRKVREKVQHFIASSESTDDQNSRIMCDLRVSPLATISELSTTHSLNYVQRFMTGDLSTSEIRNVGFPWSPSGVDRARSSVGGTVAAAVAVCQELKFRSSQRQA